MLEGSHKDILSEIYKFNQENRLEFYALIKVILEQPQCAIISKPYWKVVDGNPGAEVFTLFPDLKCTSCAGKFECKDFTEFTDHMVQCTAKTDQGKKEDDLNYYEKYGVVPKAVKALVERARRERDHKAVCIAPVLDHPEIKQLAELQRKERERITEDLAREEKAMGPSGPILKLAKGVEMPLDRMVWIQTPLSSELATLLLAGMQPIRHSPRGIHLPIVFRETGVTKVIHLNVDRFEELSAIRTAQQNYELMQTELQEVGLSFKMDDHSPLAPCIPDVMTGDPKDSFNQLMRKTLNLKRPHALMTEVKIMNKTVDDINQDRMNMDREDREKRAQDAASGNNRRTLAEIPKEKGVDGSALTTKSDVGNSMEGAKRPRNGEYSSSRHNDSTRDEQPGCSKYI